jgi:hypothetical protein
VSTKFEHEKIKASIAGSKNTLSKRETARKSPQEQNLQICSQIKPSSTKFGPDDHKEDSGLSLKDHRPKLSQSTGNSDHAKNTVCSPQNENRPDL